MSCILAISLVVETFVPNWPFEKALFAESLHWQVYVFLFVRKSSFFFAMAVAMANDRQLEKSISSTVFRLRLQTRAASKDIKNVQRPCSTLMHNCFFAQRCRLQAAA